MAEVKKEEVVKEIVVVAQLPTQPVREAEAENGKTYSIITVEEALTELLTTVREIRKAVA